MTRQPLAVAQSSVDSSWRVAPTSEIGTALALDLADVPIVWRTLGRRARAPQRRHQRASAPHRALTERLAREMGWSEEERHALELAASMHDIGKLAVPRRVLAKPGTLGPIERKIMQTHTVIGALLLQGTAGAWVRLARSIALHHHERWDGRGYPRGLAGNVDPARRPHRRGGRRLRRAHPSARLPAGVPRGASRRVHAHAARPSLRPRSDRLLPRSPARALSGRRSPAEVGLSVALARLTRSRASSSQPPARAGARTCDAPPRAAWAGASTGTWSRRCPGSP